MTTKRLFFGGLLLLLPMVTTFAQTQILEIHRWNQSSVQVILEDLQKITFSGNNLVLNMKSGDLNPIPTSDVRNLMFGIVTGIQSKADKSSSISVFPNPAVNYIRINGVGAKAIPVSVYSLSGQIVLQQIYQEGGEIVIANLHPGIYILRANDRVFKFIKE